MNHTFNSQITIAGDLPDFTQEQVKNEPMLFNCNYETARKLGGELTQAYLDALPEEFTKAKDFIVDSRVHMVMEGWWPAIPGFHHDDVPRTRADKQPNYINPEYKAEHVMALIGDCCPTEFALGQTEFPEVPIGGKYYKVWHPIVEQQIKAGSLRSIFAPSNKLLFFDWQTWHQGTAAIKNGWRWFARATKNTERKPTNELRRQVQVYLQIPMEGW